MRSICTGVNFEYFQHPAKAVLALAMAMTGSMACVAEEPIDFGRDILPILSENCFACHGPDRASAESDYQLDTQENALADLGGYHGIVPGDAKASELFSRVSTDDADMIMPPADSGLKLTPEQVELLRRWIAEGAPWSKHWSFEVPDRAEPPKVETEGWARSPIDHFVLARLEAAGLRPSPQASKRTLIRRVTLDLTGLPPTPEEVRAFLADDSPNAYEKLVDRLLASPRYGEHMAYEWLDAARYADTNGYQRDATRTMWPWRDWVVRAMNENMPFDKFVVDQVAGDLVPNRTDEQLLATGFNRNHLLNDEGGREPEESRVDYVVDRVDTTGTVFLGLTIACAQCHDHKYDPISQKEYYKFYAYFNNVDESGDVDIEGRMAKPVKKFASEEQRAELADLKSQLVDLKKQIELESTDEAIARWEERLRLKATRAVEKVWSALFPSAYVSEENAGMRLDEGGIVFVYGKNPANDSYTIEAPVSASRLTGLKLEALPHPSFTAGGYARSDSGNFVLTEMKVAYLPPGSRKPKAIGIAGVEADYHQRTHLPQRMIDGDLATGWAVLSSDMTQKRSAVFRFAEPMVVEEGGKLVIQMHNRSKHLHHNLGRFRLSVTSLHNPSLDPIERMPLEVQQAVAIARSKRTPEQAKQIREYFQQVDSRTSEIREEMKGVENAVAALESQIPQTMVMRDRKKRRSTYVLVRGAWDNPDKSEDLLPGPPSAILEVPDGAPKNRLGLANWLVDPANPLVARVAVNRYWQRFFGTGIVKTTEDFGLQGERPSHPLLLDWLATEYVASGWNTKAMHRAIVTSATYRQSSKATPELIEADPYNRLMARASRFRLEASAIRDSALAVSGLLVEKMGGKPVKPYQPEGIWLEMTLGKIKYTPDHGDDLYRRSLYTFWRRTVGPTLLFDASTRQVCAVKPNRTNTPLHALTLLNADTYIEAARLLAERMMREGGDDIRSQTTWAFELVTSRTPTQAEIGALLKSYEQLRIRYANNPAAADELLAIGERQRDAQLDTTELAARAALCNILLNLDEVITRE